MNPFRTRSSSLMRWETGSFVVHTKQSRTRGCRHDLSFPSAPYLLYRGIGLRYEYGGGEGVFESTCLTKDRLAKRLTKKSNQIETSSKTYTTVCVYVSLKAHESRFGTTMLSNGQIYILSSRFQKSLQTRGEERLTQLYPPLLPLTVVALLRDGDFFALADAVNLPKIKNKTTGTQYTIQVRG